MSYDLDPDNASILVAGGGGVALHVTRRLKNMGSWVWQLQRTDVRRKVGPRVWRGVGRIVSACLKGGGHWCACGGCLRLWAGTPWALDMCILLTKHPPSAHMRSSFACLHV